MNNNKKEQVTNLHDCHCKGIKPTIAYKYEIRINEKEYEVDNQLITGKELHIINGTEPDTHFIRQKDVNGKHLIGPNTKVNLTDCGIELFIIRPYKQESLELETCYYEGMKPYITNEYIFRVDKIKYSTSKEKITGKEILEISGKNTANTELTMHMGSNTRIISLNEEIDLTTCGVERFSTRPLNCTEGFIQKKSFNLPPKDENFLEEIRLKTDLIVERNQCWLIIREFELPPGFIYNKADCAFLINPHYPTAQIDMFYFSKHLQRNDGKGINALSNQVIEGKQYQRWSRHRVNGVWQSGVDNIATHIEYVNFCLRKELLK